MVRSSRAIWRNGHGRRYWKARDPGHRLESRRPQEDLEAAKAERKHYEELARRPPQKCIGGHTRSLAESGVRPEPTPHAYRIEPRMEPEPIRVELKVSDGSEAETVKELMGRLEERVMRELLCWCMKHDICPTERVRDLMSPESALLTRPEVHASLLVKTVPAPRTRPPVRLPSPARPVPARQDVLTMAGIVLVKHRVMRWSARGLQYAFFARCTTSQLPASAGLG